MVVTMDENTLRDLVQQGESESVEFKTVLRDSSTLEKNISALANTHGGKIIVGIQEPNKVVGTDPSQIFRLIERCRKSLSPSIDIDVATVTIEGKRVVVISVPKSPEVVLANGMALKRLGERIIPLTPREIAKKLWQESDREKIDRLSDAVSKLTNTVEQQNQMIIGFRSKQESACSLRSKAIDYIIGGFFGALFGVILTAIL